MEKRAYCPRTAQEPHISDINSINDQLKSLIKILITSDYLAFSISATKAKVL